MLPALAKPASESGSTEDDMWGLGQLTDMALGQDRPVPRLIVRGADHGKFPVASPEVRRRIPASGTLRDEELRTEIGTEHHSQPAQTSTS